MIRQVLKLVYTMNALTGSVVSVRECLPARPFGVSTGLSVRKEVGLGLGAGLAAPWPMVAAMWWSEASVRHARKAFRSLALSFLVGALAEAVTFRAMRGRISPTAQAVATLNVSIPLLLLLSPPRHDESSASPE